MGGKCGKYDFEAKVFETSLYGIDNGRVGKLAIYNEEERQYKNNYVDACSVYYDREWVKKPEGEIKSYYNELIKELENYKGVEW